MTGDCGLVAWGVNAGLVGFQGQGSPSKRKAQANICPRKARRTSMMPIEAHIEFAMDQIETENRIGRKCPIRRRQSNCFESRATLSNSAKCRGIESH
jgi:hypothetical protein